MSKKHRKSTDLFENPDEAPIVYGNPEEETETNKNDEKVGQTEKVEVDSEEDKKITENENVETKQVEEIESVVDTDDKSTIKPVLNELVDNRVDESLLTNYVTTRVIGKSTYTGTHLMSPITIANLILTNIKGDYHVLVSDNTAKLIVRIIREESARLSTHYSIEVREKFITCFLNDLKKFNF